MILDQLQVPIALAPMAGGPSTPLLAAEVCRAGGLGFLAAGYLPPKRLAEHVAELRSLTDRPFGVNVFSPPSAPADPAAFAGYVEELRRWAAERGLPLGEPRFGDDGYAAKIDMLADDPVAVVSFTFGMPDPDVVRRLHDAGSEVWATVTSPAEASLAVAGGADVLVAQGVEAGGHRGTFEDSDGAPALSLLELVGLLRGAPLPVVATGGVMSGGDAADTIAAGASAVQLGTAFMLCPEAGTSGPQRDALSAGDAPTRLTRAFTGRTARGIQNRFMLDHDASAVAAYPEIHEVTAPLRAAARQAGDASAINLWAGEGYPQIRELPAAEIVRLLAGEIEGR
jgi:nitronate monooxygenase